MLQSTEHTQNETAAAGLVAVTAAVVSLVVVNYLGVDEGEEGGTGPFLITAALSLAAAAMLFGWYVPRSSRPAVAGLALGLLAAVTAVVAFWSGLPFVLGAAAVVLGRRAQAADAGWQASAAVALGVAAVLFAAGVILFEQVG